MRQRLRRVPMTAAMMALALVGAACGTETVQRADPPAEPSDVPLPDAGDSEAEDPDVNDSDAAFEVIAYQGEELLGGSEFTFNSVLAQGKPVVLNFWAAQCPPCLTEMPWYEAAWQEHGDSVLMVGVDVGPFTGLGSNEQGAELLDELEITYPAAYAVDNEPLRLYNVTNMPFTVVFDADGQIVDDHAGILVEQQIDDLFTQLAASVE